MTYAELTRRLRVLGVEFARPAGGSHELWWHPASGRTTIIPHHAGREIRRGTLAKILKDLGVNMQDLERRG